MLSPLAPSSYPELPAIAGVGLAAAACGIRYKDRADLLVARLDEATNVAGVFTRSLAASAPVEVCRQSLKAGKARLLLVNSGNSNAFTGKSGVASCERISSAASKQFGCKPSEIFMASTGVIGEKLPDEKITAALAALDFSASWMEAAKAIMTTDTYPKLATRSADIGGIKVTLSGIAKGSGMIAPDMATLLAFVFTDAFIPQPELQHMLAEANARTFNAITVDGDTSTSDTLLLFATGKAGNSPHPYPLPEGEGMSAFSPWEKGGVSLDEGFYANFYVALSSLLHELALYVAKDGEGAEKLITIKVTGAESEMAARAIGMAIANSPLVKTAIAAADANWGRIVMAVGKAGQKANRDKLAIKIGGVSVAKNGEADPSYKESQIEAHMKGRDIVIETDVGIGKGAFTVYSCDLTHRYIDINGSYRS